MSIDSVGLLIIYYNEKSKQSCDIVYQSFWQLLLFIRDTWQYSLSNEYHFFWFCQCTQVFHLHDLLLPICNYIQLNIVLCLSFFYISLSDEHNLWNLIYMYRFRYHLIRDSLFIKINATDILDSNIYQNVYLLFSDSNNFQPTRISYRQMYAECL
jgi:hypothetical protein